MNQTWIKEILVAESNGWTFDKRISLSHIITIIPVLIAFLWWGARLENKVEINSIRIQQNVELIRQMHEHDRRQNEEILKQLSLLNEKLFAHAKEHNNTGR